MPSQAPCNSRALVDKLVNISLRCQQKYPQCKEKHRKRLASKQSMIVLMKLAVSTHSTEEKKTRRTREE